MCAITDYLITIRGRLPLAVLLLWAIALSNVRLLRSARDELDPRFNVDAALARFAPLVRDLPVGTEVNYQGVATPPPQDLEVARYALVPVRLVSNAPRPLIVVNSPDPVAGFDHEPDSNIRLVKDYGDGLRLFSREADRTWR